MWMVKMEIGWDEDVESGWVAGWAGGGGGGGGRRRSNYKATPEVEEVKIRNAYYGLFQDALR